MSKQMKLKACPFCGSEDVRFLNHKATIGKDSDQKELTAYTAGCFKCGCTTDFFNSEAKAAKVWNRRVVEE